MAIATSPRPLGRARKPRESSSRVKMAAVDELGTRWIRQDSAGDCCKAHAGGRLVCRPQIVREPLSHGSGNPACRT